MLSMFVFEFMCYLSGVFSAVSECICYEYVCRSKMNFDDRVAYVVGWVGGSVTEHLMMRSKVVT